MLPGQTAHTADIAFVLPFASPESPTTATHPKYPSSRLLCVCDAVSLGEPPMNRSVSTLSLAIIALSLLPLTALAAPGELLGIERGTNESPFGYFEYLPEAYDSRNDWPVLIFLSGIGEFGDGSLPNGQQCTSAQNFSGNLCGNLQHGPQSLIFRNDWDDVDRPFVVIGPQNNGQPLVASAYNTADFGRLIDVIIENYNIDERRIYLTGMSMGGASAATIMLTEKRIAAWASMPGLYTPIELPCHYTQRPMWSFYGENDTFATGGNRFDPQEMLFVHRRFSACPGPLPETRFTIYQDRGHNVWTETFNLAGMNIPTLDTYDDYDLNPYDVTIYDWLLQFDRPTVDAGRDVVANLSVGTVELLATTLDDSAETVAWAQISGPTVTLGGATTPSLQLSDLVPGEYAFEATVRDEENLWSTDTVTVTIVDDTPITAGDESGELDGAGSLDGANGASTGQADDGGADDDESGSTSGGTGSVASGAESTDMNDGEGGPVAGSASATSGGGVDSVGDGTPADTDDPPAEGASAGEVPSTSGGADDDDVGAAATTGSADDDAPDDDAGGTALDDGASSCSAGGQPPPVIALALFGILLLPTVRRRRAA